MNIKKTKDEIPTCETKTIHNEVIKKVKKNFPKEEIIINTAEFFKVLGDATRMKILSALFQEEMCVCDIANLLNMTQSAISHQLRVLKQTRLVKYRKEGKVVYYSLEDEHVKHIVDESISHILEKK
ncbi:ArsR/SmtB family transcription factor [Leptotrichia sp. oral taxon 847]|uniref:ArsR/SmtB family transcription factor n=1 Tax=Leptotrichia sp. oral taxon 847 TaxID=1785996 RepID=UPI0009EB91B4